MVTSTASRVSCTRSTRASRSSIARRLRAIPMERTETRFVGLTFRVMSPRYSDLLRTAAMSRSFPGRFNTPSVGAVYVSLEPETAVEELRRRGRRDGVSLTDMHPRSLFVIDLLLHQVVDLTLPGQRKAWGLFSQDLEGEEMDRCREVADVAARAGAEGIRWPSATGSGQSIAVFLEQFRPRSRASNVRAFEITRDVLQAIQEGESVRTLFPELIDIAPNT